MNAEEAREEMALAAYDMAESERLERRAKKLRISAIRRTAKVHAYFKEGVEEAQKQQEQENDD